MTLPSASRKYREHIAALILSEGAEPMKFVQWTLAVIGTIALVAVAAGVFLPSAVTLQASIEINATPKKVYDLIVEPKRWKDWSVWSRRDPDMQITYSGPPFGMGAKWAWVSKGEGTGRRQ